MTSDLNKDHNGRKEEVKTANSSAETQANGSQASERLETATPKVPSRNYLGEMGIECHQMEWQTYRKTICSDRGPLFDFILTDPPYGTPQSRSGAGVSYDNFVHKDEMVEMAQYCRRALKPGSWILIFTSMQYFNECRSALEGVGFRCPGYSYVVMKNTESVQGNRSVFFPQNVCEHILFGLAPGSRPDGFKTDRTSPYHFLKSKQKRRFAAVSDVPVTTNKLKKPGTKSPVLVEEKNPKLLAELLTTFCPESGRVMYMYAGTMSTAIACMMTKRPCVCIEADASTFRLAHDRLRLQAQAICLSSGNLQDNATKKRKSDDCTIAPTNISPLSTITGASVTTGVCGDKQNQGFSEQGNEAVENDRDGVNQKETLMDEKSEVAENEMAQDEQNHVSFETETGLAPGDAVSLIMGGKFIGSAALQYEREEGAGLVTTLHGNNLSNHQNESNGWHLVSVFRVRIEKEYLSMKYPYTYDGQEPPPETLGGLNTGFHAWDLNSMKKME